MVRIIIGIIGLVSLLQAELLILYVDYKGDILPYNVQSIQKHNDLVKIQKIADLHGIKIKLKSMPWKRALLMLKKGKADGTINASYKEERALYSVYPMKNNKLDASRKLNNGSSYYIYKNKKSTLHWDGKKFLNIDGAVGVMTKYAVIDDLKKHKNIKIVERNNRISLMRDMATGKLSAYAGTKVYVDKVLNEYPQFTNKIVMEPYPIRKKDYYLIFSKKSYKNKKEEIEKIWDGLKSEKSL